MLKQKKGFTLAELLVVIVIIAALSSMAVPQFFKVIERGKLTEAITILNAIRMELITEYDLSDSYPSISELNVEIINRKYFEEPEISTTGNAFPVSIKRNDSNASGRYGAYTVYINQEGKIWIKDVNSNRHKELGYNDTSE